MLNRPDELRGGTNLIYKVVREPPLIADPLRRWAALFLIWTAIGLFFVGQSMVRRMMFDMPFEWRGMLGYEMIYWYVWALLTPVVLWFTRAHPIRGSERWRDIARHSLLAIVMAFLHAVGAVQLMMWTLGPPRRGGAPLTMSHYITQELPAEMFTGFYKYWLIVLIYSALLNQRKLREREVAAAQLETKLSQAQLQALKMQLHPHFLFNTLHAVSMLNFTDVDAANRMLVQLSDLLRTTLDNSGAQEVRLRQELDFLRRYLEIEQTRFHDRLRVNIDADPKLLDAQVPNLILQPLVENAIRHGIGKLARAGRVEIRAFRQENDLVLEVQDDGAGLPHSWDSERDAGIGLSNTKARLRQLYGERHSFEMISRDGVLVRIRLPLSFGPRNATE